MAVNLPHPNIETRPGAHLDSAALAAIFQEIQGNFDALATQSRGPRIVRGYVDSAGGVTGNGFSVAHPETGVYAITFTTPFPVVPVITGNDAQGTQRTVSTSGQAETGFTVTMSAGTGPKEDIGFSFIAIG